jgi:hypothetical protein
MLDQILQDAKEAGQLDRKDQIGCAPYHSARYKALLVKHPKKFERKMLQAYVDAHRGFKLDISRLPPFNRR